ncbi:MAG TPA: hypothetical protein VM120_19385, partial [Bryobacteraceae bacterium]|nr:hypothetical protein [Bryobacteraceae bacterium]
MAYTYQDFVSGGAPPKGWDFADAIDDGWTAKEIIAAIRAEAKPYEPDAPVPVPKTNGAHPPAASPRQPEVPAVAKPAAKQTLQVKPVGEVVSFQTKQTFSPEDGWKGRLIMKEKDKPDPKLFQNWAAFLTYHPRMEGVFAWNQFSNRVMVLKKPPWHGNG